MDVSTSRRRPPHRLSTIRWVLLAPGQRLPCAARPELLDLPGVDPADLRGNLADLTRVNRLLGGASLTRRALARLVDDGPVRMLDIGTGAADIPAAAVAWSPHRGRALRVVGVDRSLPILRAARGVAPHIPLAAADGRALPFRTDAFDVAHCSLVLHHLDPADAVPFLAEMARVARRGVIVNDLVRSRVGSAGAWLLAHLATRNPLTRHDAPLSARRAYTLAEIGDLMAAAGLRVLATERALGYRAAVIGVTP
ncbi:MAG: methyltransferase domain-containing protein [Sphaerobacter sp.]|nr:methyltransferase domain-containing protein [Sphaerobacter sp.]